MCDTYTSNPRKIPAKALTGDEIDAMRKKFYEENPQGKLTEHTTIGPLDLLLRELKTGMTK